MGNEIAKKEKPLQMSSVENPDNTGMRTIEEVKGAILVAKHCPRDEQFALAKIEKACQNIALAECANYSYPRGGEKIEGPSIRLAETLARHWGNMQYGIRELESDEEKTKFETFCWDVENNVRACRIFSQKHLRYTKNGIKKLVDPRDIYEAVANTGARRLRACILELIPGEVVDRAVEICNQTLANKIDLNKALPRLLGAFESRGVTKVMIEKRLRHNIDAVTTTEFVKLNNIFQSIKDGMGHPSDYFEGVVDPNGKKVSQESIDNITALCGQVEDGMARLLKHLAIKYGRGIESLSDLMEHEGKYALNFMNQQVWGAL